MHCQKYGLENPQDTWLPEPNLVGHHDRAFLKNKTKINGISCCVSCLCLHPIYSSDLYLLLFHPLTRGKVTCYFSTRSFFNLMCCCCFICNCCVILTPIVRCVPTDMSYKVTVLKYLTVWKSCNKTLKVYCTSYGGMNAKLSCSFPPFLPMCLPLPLPSFLPPSFYFWN